MCSSVPALRPDLNHSRFVTCGQGSAMSLDAMLQPIVDALAPTEVGPPKTQAVIDQHLETFKTLLKGGFTYKQIAAGLNAKGGRGRRGAEFTGQSLYTFISRSKGRIDRSPAAATGQPSARRTDYDTLTTPPIGVQSSSTSPELDQFRQRINEARTQAEMDEILFRRRKPR
jgi:hypothetical protein